MMQPMAFVRATVKLPYTGGLSRDVAENTFSFSCNDGFNSTAQTAIVNRLKDFYNTAALGGASHSISYYISPLVSRASLACSIVMAETNVTTGVQVGDSVEATWTIGGAENSATSLPLECAVCVSYSGDPDGGFLPKGQRRGRIFLGPLTNTTLNAATDPSVATTFRNEAAAAAAALAGSADTTAAWVIWSRVANAVTGISRGYIDNEFDTQRRRGNDATSRTTWTP